MNILFILFIAVRTSAIAFQCEKGRNGVLCLHEILLHLKSEFHQEINSNGRHLITIQFHYLESTYGFTQEHYNDVIPPGAGLTTRIDNLHTHGNIVISRKKVYNQRTIAVEF